MKRLLINVRGASASGKTTMVKQFCDRYGFNVEIVQTPFSTLPVSVLTGRAVIVLGDYSASGKCLGADRYKNGTKDIMDAIMEICAVYSPSIIIYEHMISSNAARATKEIAKIAALFGMEYLGVQIAISEEKRAENLLRRSGANAGKKYFAKNDGRAVGRATNKLREAGCNVVVKDAENIQQDEMWRILDGAIREALK